MPYNPNNPYSSLDVRTGMLQDPDEIRQVSLRVLHFIKTIIMHPAALMGMSMEALIVTAEQLAVTESMLRPMSQADTNRLVGALCGVPTEFTEDYIRELHLSETLPNSHPDAPKAFGDLPLTEDQEEVLGTPTEPLLGVEPVQLPDSIERFLQSFTKGEYEPEGD